MLKPERYKIVAIVDWCRERFGESKYNPPDPFIVMELHNDDVYGAYYFEENEIHIVPSNHKSYLNLCNTVLHEYKHYLQSAKKYHKLDMKLRKEGTPRWELSSKHPHEIKCNAFAEEWQHLCYRELEPILRSHKKRCKKA